MQKIFFNSSMPRAGSTLLQNIFNQNPSIHATPSDGGLELFFGARANYTNGLEFKAQDQKQMENAWKYFCKRGLQGYCEGLTKRPVVVLKSRGYGIHYKWFNWFMEEPPKIVCMIRDIKGIISSMEKIYRKNPQSHSFMVDHAKMQGTTTNKRAMMWLQTQPIGLALERFHQMILEGIDKKVHFVRVEDLVTDPQGTMKKVYNYLEIPYYEHNFNHIEQTTKEDDAVHGFPDLHTIKNKLEPMSQDWLEVLGADTCNEIDFRLNWYQTYFGYNNNQNYQNLANLPTQTNNLELF